MGATRSPVKALMFCQQNFARQYSIEGDLLNNEQKFIIALT